MTTTAMQATPSPAQAARKQHVTDQVPIGRVLRAIILKEMRQNLMLVGLAFLLVVIVDLLAEFFRSGFLSYNYNPINVLLYDSIRSMIPLACAVAGFVLGVVQPLSDINFDRWAFLIHRPVPRSVLYWGRALAGLLLYFIVVGLPLIGLILYSLTSEGGRYFVWQYTLPPVADFFTGIAYYFTGLLVADRKARYYGSRLAPLILAFAASFCAIIAPSFWLAMVGNFFFASLLAMAALGSAVSHGYALKPPAWMRGVLAAAMLLAFSILLAVPARVTQMSVYEALRPDTGHLEWWHFKSSKSYRLLGDGTFVEITSVRVPPYDEPNDVTTYTDLVGHTVPPVTPEQPQEFEQSASLSPDSNSPRAINSYRDVDRLVTENVFTQALRYPGDPVRPPEDHWFFDSTRNRYYLYKYPPEPYQWAGTLGANGFVAAPALAEPFESPMSNYDGFITRHTLYQVDLQAARAVPIFTVPANEYIRAYRNINTGTSLSPIMDNLYVLTDKHLYYLTTTGSLLLQLPIDRNVVDYLTVRYMPEKHWWVLIYHAGPGAVANAFTNFHYEFYDDAGKFVSERDLQSEYVAVRSQQTPVNEAKLALLKAEDGIASAICPIFQLGVGLLANTDVGFHVPFNPARIYTAGIADYQWLTNLLFFGCLVIFVALMKPLTAYYRLSHTWVWYLLALFTGPAALLTLFATQKYPRRIRCPVCATPRPLISPTCPICHAPWPTPPQTGTEIIT